MSDLFVRMSFGATLSDRERAFLAQLPLWPTTTKLTASERELVPRLKRLGCIQVEHTKDDPIQIHFDVYGGATFVGRRAETDGIVRIDPNPDPDQ